LPAFGVGHNPESVSDMWGTNGRRWNAVPFRVIPDLGQPPEYVAHPSITEAWDVLHEDVSGSKCANGSKELRPEPPGIVLRESLSCEADRLAWEPAGDEIDRLDGRPVDSGDVSVSGNIGPVVGEDVLAVGVPFDLPAALPSGSLQSEVDAADAGEQASEGRHVTDRSPAARSRPAP
jgi:hypothetical protein